MDESRRGLRIVGGRGEWIAMVAARFAEGFAAARILEVGRADGGGSEGGVGGWFAATRIPEVGRAEAGLAEVGRAEAEAGAVYTKLLIVSRDRGKERFRFEKKNISAKFKKTG
jgi:hypothetical protein